MLPVFLGLIIGIWLIKWAFTPTKKTTKKTGHYWRVIDTNTQEKLAYNTKREALRQLQVFRTYHKNDKIVYTRTNSGNVTGLSVNSMTRYTLTKVNES